MTRIECPGLDGSNPLHFLASLGFFRLLDRCRVNATVQWQVNGGVWFPIYEMDGSIDGLLDEVVAAIVSDASTNAEKTDQVDGPKSKDIKSAEDALKNAERVASEEAKRNGLSKRDALAFVRNLPQIVNAQRKLDELRVLKAKAQEDRSASLGFGIAHYGDIVSVPLTVARRHAERSISGLIRDGLKSKQGFVAEQLASLGTEVIRRDGTISPTPFSFSNGQGGQLLLKNFRDCAELVTSSGLANWICGQFPMSSGVTSLNWDPMDRNDYALRWSDPGKGGNKSSVNFIGNALGYYGLGFFTSVPVSSEKLETICWEYGFCWGLWSVPLSLDMCRGLLHHVSRAEIDTLKIRGMEAFFFSERLAVGAAPATRFYFAPSRSI